MNVKGILFNAVTLGIFALSLFIPIQIMANESPCGASLQYLKTQYDSDQATRKAFDKVYVGLTDLPAGYSYNGSAKNPWKAAGSGKGMHRKMVKMFKSWCTATTSKGSSWRTWPVRRSVSGWSSVT